MKNLLLSTAVAVCLAGPISAQSSADVAAAIDAGIAEMNASGANLTFGARETGAGDSIILRDVRLAPDDADIVIATDSITMTPSATAPGDVIVTVADEIRITATDTDAPLEVVVASSGLELVTNLLIEGGRGKPALAVRADAMRVTGGSDDHPVLKALDIAQEDFSFEAAFDEATRSLAGALKIANLTGTYKMGDAYSEGTQATTFNYEGYDITFSADNIPQDEDGMKAFVDNDGAFKFVLEAGGADMSLVSTDPAMPLSVSGTGGPGDAEISLQDGVFVYKANFTNVDYNVALDPNVMPIPPFDVSLSGGLMDIRVPVRPTDGETEVVMDLALRDLTLGDSLWDTFNPQGGIPRDPATLEINLGAKVDLQAPLVESLDDDGTGDINNPMDLGEIKSLDITRVFLTLGGATLDASGALTMLNDGPFPMPNGEINVSLVGVQALANSLAEIGLVDQMQVGMAMGMMMAFAKPGAEPDSFSSRIEFRDGGIFANGTPIQ